MKSRGKIGLDGKKKLKLTVSLHSRQELVFFIYIQQINTVNKQKMSVNIVYDSASLFLVNTSE